MKRKTRHFTAEFKARVAAEAFKGEKSIQPIAKENDTAPSQVSIWKKCLEDHMASIFERRIGQLVIEKHFLKNSANSSGSI